MYLKVLKSLPLIKHAILPQLNHILKATSVAFSVPCIECLIYYAGTECYRIICFYSNDCWDKKKTCDFNRQFCKNVSKTIWRTPRYIYLGHVVWSEHEWVGDVNKLSPAGHVVFPRMINTQSLRSYTGFLICSFSRCSYSNIDGEIVW